MARKTGKELRIEYQDLLDKTEALQKRIIKRAKDLATKYPDIVVAETVPNKGNVCTRAYANIENLNIVTAFSLIEIVEEYLASKHPHKQLKLYEVNVLPDFIEYQDNNDDYESPERKEVTEQLEIRLYCMHEGCKTYIKGIEGYNGAFRAETGQFCDLRNQGFTCIKHQNENSI